MGKDGRAGQGVAQSWWLVLGSVGPGCAGTGHCGRGAVREGTAEDGKALAAMATSLDFSGALGSHRLVKREGVCQVRKATVRGQWREAMERGQENNLDSEPGEVQAGARGSHRASLRTGAMSRSLKGLFPQALQQLC